MEQSQLNSDFEQLRQRSIARYEKLGSLLAALISKNGLGMCSKITDEDIREIKDELRGAAISDPSNASGDV